jgi:hypothetical protein
MVTEIIDGTFFDTSNARVLSISKQNSFSDCEHLYRQEKGKYKIVIGYAFDIEEWVSHSWLVDEDNVLYETTPFLREAYFGVSITTKRGFKKFLRSYRQDKQS